MNRAAAWWVIYDTLADDFEDQRAAARAADRLYAALVAKDFIKPGGRKRP